MKNKVVYEQPLSERARVWLRLEYLFECLAYHMKGPSSWDSRVTVSSVIEILEFVSRTDFKLELIRDLEKQTQELTRWQQMPGVDEMRLAQVLERLGALISELVTAEGQYGQALNEHYLLATIRQRNNIPGGTCRFDVPAYHHWLQQSPKQRQIDVGDWFKHFSTLREAVEMNLYLIRQNAVPSHEIATGGFYQAKLDTHTTFQLIRITMPVDHSCYPEISGGKHRFTLRFYEHQQRQYRPIPTEQDVHFELCCCSAA